MTDWLYLVKGGHAFKKSFRQSGCSVNLRRYSCVHTSPGGIRVQPANPSWSARGEPGPGVVTRSRLSQVPGTARLGPLRPPPLGPAGKRPRGPAARRRSGRACQGAGAGTRARSRDSGPGLPRGPQRPACHESPPVPQSTRGLRFRARPGPSGARQPRARSPAAQRPAPTARRRGHGVGLGLHPPAWAAFPRPFPRATPAPGGRPPLGAEPGPSSSSRCPAPGPGCPAAEAAAVLTQTASWECCSPLGPAREKKNVFQASSPSPGPDSSIYSP